jgi:hypothetical protein
MLTADVVSDVLTGEIVNNDYTGGDISYPMGLVHWNGVQKNHGAWELRQWVY